MGKIHQDETRGSPAKGYKTSTPVNLKIYKVFNSLCVGGKHAFRISCWINILIAQFDFVEQTKPVSLQWRAYALGSFIMGVIERKMGNEKKGVKPRQYSVAVAKAVFHLVTRMEVDLKMGSNALSSRQLCVLILSAPTQ